MKIFLGYASEHLSTAKEFVDFLRSLGHEVWFDKDALIPGVEWDRERAGGQSEADLIVHLCSREILTRRGVVNREIRETLRLSEDQPFGALFAIFVRLEDFRLPVELTRFQYVNYFEADWQNHIERAITRRQGELRDGVPAIPKREVLSHRYYSKSNRLEFSDATKFYECVGNYFVYDGEGLYWTFVNSKVAAHVLGEFTSIRRDFTEYMEMDRDKEWSPESRYYWEMSTEEFSVEGDILSLRFYTYHYAGGAHPNHHITTLNFLGQQFGQPTIDELLNRDEGNARKILTYCEKVVLASLGDEAPDGFFDGVADEVDALWRLLAQFNLDRRGITFNFSPYDVLAYAYGSHEALVPWTIIEEMLSPIYKDLPFRLGWAARD